MELSIDQRFELDSLRGRPDGPVRYVPELDEEVPTYVDPRKDLYPNGIEETLMYHVPLKFRGPYKAGAGASEGPNRERIGPNGYCLCMGHARIYASNHPPRKSDGLRHMAKNAGKPCGLKAQNRSGYCGWHGGALHPLDKSKPKVYTREFLFAYGKLPIEELDDEELARGQIRRSDGTWTNNKNIPREVFQAAQAELFKRADQRLRENLMTAVDTMAEIASGSAYEPEVRIRAAQFIYERVRGKNPDVVIHTQDKPFEVMMTDMVLGGGSRAASRAQRGLESAVDAEVVEDYGIDVGDHRLGDEHDDSGVDTVEDEPGIEVELIPLTPELPKHYGSAGKPMTTPPVDPLLREKWEKDRLANEASVEETVQVLKARLDAARRKRYASRGKGLDHVESYAHGWDNREGDEWQRDPDEPEYEIPVNIVRFRQPVLPKVPAHVKREDTRRIRRGR